MEIKLTDEQIKRIMKQYIGLSKNASPIIPSVSEETKKQWMNEYFLLQERGKRKEKLIKLWGNVNRS